MALDSYASPNIIPELRQPNAAAGKITLGAGQNGCYAQCEEKKAKYGRISIRTDLVIRLYSTEGTMTNLQLEERFRALEKRLRCAHFHKIYCAERSHSHYGNLC